MQYRMTDIWIWDGAPEIAMGRMQEALLNWEACGERHQSLSIRCGVPCEQQGAEMHSGRYRREWSQGDRCQGAGRCREAGQADKFAIYMLRRVRRRKGAMMVGIWAGWWALNRRLVESFEILWSRPVSQECISVLCCVAGTPPDWCLVSFPDHSSL